MDNRNIKVQLDNGAKKPTRAHTTDAGLDLYTRESKTIKAHGSETFDTGVHVELPQKTYGKIASKSGLNVNHSVVSCGGTIDQGYTGSIKVKLYNLGDEDYTFKCGEKIAQLVIQPCLFCDVEVVDEINKETDRMDNGFGSTGK